MDLSVGSSKPFFRVDSVLSFDANELCLVSAKKENDGTRGSFRANRFFELPIFDVSELHCISIL